MGQRPVAEAPAVAVLAADTRAADAHFADVLAADRAAGAVSPEYEALLRRVVPLSFARGPVGLGWLLKALLVPVARLAVPVPEVPAVHGRVWATRQAMLAAMAFMLAASAAGLATLPMEGFDERRVRRLLGVPRRFVVPVVIPVGYPAEGSQVLRKTRLPLERVVHRDRW